MKIGIDGRSLFYGGGSQNYVYNLITHLPKIDSENEYYFYISKTKDKKLLSRLNSLNVNVKEINAPKLLWDQIAIPSMIRKDNLDIYHSTKSNVPCLSRDVVNITTFHGMDFRAKLKYFSIYENLINKHISNYIFWDTMCRLSAKLSDHIITISEHAKNKIMEYYSVDERKISVIYEAAGEEYRVYPKKDVNALLSKFAIEKPFILCVSKYSPKKNIETVIKVLNNIKREYPNYPNISLVMAGKWDSKYKKRILSLAVSLGVEKDIKFLGFVPEKELPLLFNGALALFFPSRYEGFGIPIVEAFSCGTPVITSNREAIPEISGGAAISLEFNDITGYTEAISKLIEDNSFRHCLSNKSLKRSKYFSWEKTAKDVLDVYERCSKNKLEKIIRKNIVNNGAENPGGHNYVY